jgi:hypothetical protein
LEGNSSGRPIIAAAVILGVAVVVASFLLKTSIDHGASELQAAVKGLDTALTKLAEATPAPPAARPSRPGRPDPDRKYTVAVGNAPTKGPKSAAVKIVEWSDFQ